MDKDVPVFLKVEMAGISTGIMHVGAETYASFHTFVCAPKSPLGLKPGRGAKETGKETMATTTTYSTVPPNLLRERLVARFMAVPAAVAVVAALVELLWHGSGVSFTAGAGLSLFGCVALLFGAVMLMVLRPGGLRTTFTVLLLIGGVLTALAAWFLESHLVLIAVLAMLLGWLIFILVAR